MAMGRTRCRPPRPSARAWPRPATRCGRWTGATIPEEIKQARWIVKERQEMLAEAKRDCGRGSFYSRGKHFRALRDGELVAGEAEFYKVGAEVGQVRNNSESLIRPL